MQKRLLLIGMLLVMVGLWVSFSSFIAWDAAALNQLPGHMLANLQGRKVIHQQGMPPARLQPPFRTGLEPLLPNERALNIKGSLQVDAAGQLLVTADVRQVFDSFLHGFEEAPFEQTVARIRAYINSKLSGSAAQQAHRLLERYLALRQAVDENPRFSEAQLLEQVYSEAELIHRKNELAALRLRHLGEAAAVFFAEETARDDFFILRQRILAEPETPALEKAQRIGRLLQTLPESGMDEVLKQRDLQRLTRLWFEQGGDVATLRQIRQAIVGAHAAAELDAQDKAHAQWDIRVAHWLELRKSLLGDSELKDSEKMSQLDFQRSHHFTFEELALVKQQEVLHDKAYAQ